MNVPTESGIAEHTHACEKCHAHDTCISKYLSEAELDQLDASIIPVQRLVKGTHVFLQGQPLKSVCLVKFGTLKSSLTDQDGNEQIVAFHFAGDMVGTDCFESGRHNTTSTTLQDTGLCMIPWQEFNSLRDHCPHFRDQIFNLMSRELTHAHELIKVLSQKSVEQKLAYFLMLIARKMSLQGYSKETFNLPMTREEIANFLGIAASETISREFSELHRRGIIDVTRRHIEILKPNELEKLAEATGPGN